MIWKRLQDLQEYIMEFFYHLKSPTDQVTSDPSGQVARNVPLNGLFEMRKKRNTLYMVYTLYMVFTL
jgi:hypothetical protein